MAVFKLNPHKNAYESKEINSSSDLYYQITPTSSGRVVIKNNSDNLEENIIQELNEKYFKIKDCLIRCGNVVFECNKTEIKNILFSFFNLKKFLDK